MRETLYKTGFYEPIIEREGDALIYAMPVDSGFASWIVDIPVTQRDVDILTKDARRWLMLFVVLHPRYQTSATAPAAEEARALIDSVLHASDAALDALAAANSSVAYFYGQLLAARGRA